MTAGQHLRVGLIRLALALIVFLLTLALLYGWVSLWNALSLHPMTIIFFGGVVTLCIFVAGVSAVVVGLVMLLNRRRA